MSTHRLPRQPRRAAQACALSANAVLWRRATGGAACSLRQETARRAALRVRHAAGKLRCHLERISRRAAVSSYTESDKPARSTRDSPALGHGAMPKATGRACNAERTLVERLSSSDKQPACCLSISGASRAKPPSAVTLTTTSPRAQRANRPSYATAPCHRRRGVRIRPRRCSQSGSPRPTGSRHAAGPSLAHLWRACVSRHADGDKPARSTRCPSAPRHGAVPLATGRAYQA